MENEAQKIIQKPALNNWTKILSVALLELLIIATSLYAGFQMGRNSLNSEPVLVESPTPIPFLTPTTPPPLITNLPSITTSASIWKTFANDELTFQYPSSWTQNQNRIIGSHPTMVLSIITKETSLMNECMHLDATEKRNGFVIKKFSRVTTGEMCSTQDSSPREMWIIPKENDYAPGLSYRYSTQDNPEAENIFNQILSTFKFIN